MFKSYTDNFALAIINTFVIVCDLIYIWKTSQIIEGYYTRVQSWFSVMISGALALFFLGCGIYRYRRYLKPESSES